MLKTIVQQSQSLVAFISGLQLALYQPQKRHLIQLLEALLVCNGRKTLSDLYRLWVGNLDPKTAADFFRESPWKVEAISGPRKRWMLQQMLGIARQLGHRVGDPDRRGRQPGQKGQSHPPSASGGFPSQSHRKHEQETGLHQWVCVRRSAYPDRPDRISVRYSAVPTGEEGAPAQPGPRSRTPAALSQQVQPGSGDAGRASRFAAQGHQVYVLFDSWYASAKLIKFCRRQRWHVICAVKSNRRIEKKRIDHYNQALKHKPTSE